MNQRLIIVTLSVVAALVSLVLGNITLTSRDYTMIILASILAAVAAATCACMALRSVKSAGRWPAIGCVLAVSLAWIVSLGTRLFA